MVNASTQVQTNPLGTWTTGGAGGVGQSIPSSTRPLQSLSRPSHTSGLGCGAEHGVQPPFTQLFTPSPHAVEQGWSWSPSSTRPLQLLSMPSQISGPVGMQVWHCPFWQVCPGAHAFRHLPQFCASLLSDASQPLAALPSQSSNPELHAPLPQVPLTHVGWALAARQCVAHCPQLFTSLRRGASQPLTGLPSQLP